MNFCENFRQSLTGIFIKMGVRYLKLEKGGEKWKIETTAEIIMKDALQKKKALSAEMERQSKEFDTQLEKQTEEQIKEIRRNLEGEKDKRLSSLREDTQAALSQLDAYYAKNHERLSREIFEKIIQEEVM